MTIKSRRSLFLPIFIYASDMCVQLPVERRAFFISKKFFWKIWNLVFRFLTKNLRCNGVSQKLTRTLTIKYTFIRYVAWAMGETLSRTKVRQDPPAAYGISGTQGGERPRNRFRNIRLPRIRRWQAQVIMILLYGAGGEPGRGETPMDPTRNWASDDFPSRRGCWEQILRPVHAVLWYG